MTETNFWVPSLANVLNNRPTTSFAVLSIFYNTQGSCETLFIHIRTYLPNHLSLGPLTTLSIARLQDYYIIYRLNEMIMAYCMVL
jgi:hypothetical protein